MGSRTTDNSPTTADDGADVIWTTTLFSFHFLSRAQLRLLHPSDRKQYNTFAFSYLALDEHSYTSNHGKQIHQGHAYPSQVPGLGVSEMQRNALTHSRWSGGALLTPRFTQAQVLCPLPQELQPSFSPIIGPWSNPRLRGSAQDHIRPDQEEQRSEGRRRQDLEATKQRSV